MRVKLLTLARDLQRRRARERNGLFVAEGVRTVAELLRSPLAVEGVLAAPSLAASPHGSELLDAVRARAIPVLDASEHDFASAATTDSPQGVLAIAAIPDRHPSDVVLEPPGRLLVLDGVQDPGNVGTLVRTAAAFSAAATLAMPGTVDVWNAKVVRSAMGALFHHPAMTCSWSELDALVAVHDVPLWGADGAGEPVDRLTAPPALGLVVGNEGAGLSPDARTHVSRLAAIPIAPGVESLNVAVAAGILLFALRP